jgi:uncharacterized protein (TIGR03435 family)
MKRAILLAAAPILAAFAVYAQSSASQPAAPQSVDSQAIVGTWQGTLVTGGQNPPRIAFTIRKDPDGTLRGGIKWIDYDFGFAFTTIAFSAPDLTVSQGADGMSFHGKLSADGQSIAGTVTQGSRSFPLTLSLATADTLWKPAGPGPMAANADPSYEVAIIKPALPDEQHPIWNLTSPEFHATGTNAAELIKMVYKIRGRQILNAPPWVEQDKFDITAKPDTPGTPSEDQSRTMIGKLLADRFHLVCHTSTQDYPALVMTLDPKGPPPTPSDAEFNSHNGISMRQENGDVVLHLTGTTMPFFLKTLMDRYRDKQIVDETGLTGIYDITLRLPPAALQGSGDGGAEEEVGTDYIAAAEKAGFKFVSRKAPLPVVVIDHIDPPSPN